MAQEDPFDKCYIEESLKDKTVRIVLTIYFTVCIIQIINTFISL